MSNEFDRLRAANPATEGTYQHASLEAVAKRAERVSTSSSARFAQGFRVKMASAAMAAAMLTSGGILAIESSSPSLPILALEGTSPAASFDVRPAPSNKLAPSGSMMIWGTYKYEAASSLSAAPGIAPVYKVLGPSSIETTALSLAKALGIYSSGVSLKTEPQIAQMDSSRSTNSSYTTDLGTLSLTANESGPTTWYFNAPWTTAVSSDSSGSISDADISRWSKELIDALSFGMTLSEPTYNSWGTSGTATYQVLVDGHATDMSISLTFDANGTLQWADGTVASFEFMGNYPLISEHDGVTSLANAASKSSTPRGPVMMNDTPKTPIAEPSTGGETSTPATNETTTTEVLTPPTITILLTDATVQLSLQTLADGSSWLVPMYIYTGTSTFEDGASNTGTWSTIAVDPAYLKIEPAPGPIVYSPMAR